jgi:chromosome segregation ATPase
MKKNAILAFVVAGALSFSACNSKVDEKTLGEITQFGTDWTSLGEKATAWSQQMSETATKAKEFAQKQSEMAASMANSKDEAMKAKSNEMSQMATADASKLENMQNEWNTFKATWDETTKSFGEWKDKVTKGEINAADAVKGITDFKTKMGEAQTKFEGWNNAFAETKTSCDKNMAAAEEMAKSMTPGTAKK